MMSILVIKYQIYRAFSFVPNRIFDNGDLGSYVYMYNAEGLQCTRIIRYAKVKGFITVFSRRQIGFHRQTNIFELNLCKTAILEDGQIKHAKLFLQPINLPGTWLLMKPLQNLLCFQESLLLNTVYE